MARWQPDAENRLRTAALDLFEERGFEDTTVAEIAERANLTKRTFFRYFADKREVLFSNQEEFERPFKEAIRDAPAGSTPLEAIGAGLDALGTFLQPRGGFAPRRQAILDANPELRERELSKMASLAATGAEELRKRGVGEPAATLAAESAAVILRSCYSEWVGGGGTGDVSEMMRDAVAELRDLK